MKNIRYSLEDDGKESIFIEFNRFYTPVIFAIPGKEPRIVLDITNISSFKKKQAIISVGGKLIKRIRSSINHQTNEARIIIDLNPSKDYSVNPVFYEKDNIYSLEI
ncbi:MAG: AMIN domain-containing protein, partial [Syntrophales bacterium LBB04]|nr:AMIN domain-containing protein [Syntrophales bacterium LBB04]